jgi:hypothetical protein
MSTALFDPVYVDLPYIVPISLQDPFVWIRLPLCLALQ